MCRPTPMHHLNEMMAFYNIVTLRPSTLSLSTRCLSSVTFSSLHLYPLYAFPLPQPHEMKYLKIKVPQSCIVQK